MKLVRVAPSDAALLEQVSRISQSHEVARALLAKEERQATSGLLVAGYRESDFKHFLETGGDLAVALAGAQEQIAGYVLTNPGTAVGELRRTFRIDWLRGNTDKSFREAFECGRFTYLDQIGVTREFHGQGVAQILREHSEQLWPNRYVAALVLQKPIHNVRSHRFFERGGYSLVAHASISSHKTLGGEATLALFVKG